MPAGRYGKADGFRALKLLKKQPLAYRKNIGKIFYKGLKYL